MYLSDQAKQNLAAAMRPYFCGEKSVPDPIGARLGQKSEWTYPTDVLPRLNGARTRTKHFEADPKNAEIVEAIRQSNDIPRIAVSNVRNAFAETMKPWVKAEAVLAVHDPLVKAIGNLDTAIKGSDFGRKARAIPAVKQLLPASFLVAYAAQGSQDAYEKTGQTDIDHEVRQELSEIKRSPLGESLQALNYRVNMFLLQNSGSLKDIKQAAEKVIAVSEALLPEGFDRRAHDRQLAETYLPTASYLYDKQIVADRSSEKEILERAWDSLPAEAFGENLEEGTLFTIDGYKPELEKRGYYQLADVDLVLDLMADEVAALDARANELFGAKAPGRETPSYNLGIGL